jgi:Arc/MetJ-type ribon-helix-helix transcriptional regulator
MIRTQIQLTEEQSRRIKSVARQENISMAQAIRDAIDDWLERRSELTEAERWERSLGVVGRYRSGLSDLAEDHDRYLAEAYEDYQDE